MMTDFFSKINIRQLSIHFAASWLFIYAFHTLAYLYDYKLLTSDSVRIYQVIFKERFATDLAIIDIAGSIGLFTAFIISWHLSNINNWFWPTSVVVFLIAFLLYYFNLLGWSKLQYIFIAPGRLFSAWNHIVGLVLNGGIMFAIGLYLLVGKKIVAYINRGVKKERAVVKT